MSSHCARAMIARKFPHESPAQHLFIIYDEGEVFMPPEANTGTTEREERRRLEREHGEGTTQEIGQRVTGVAPAVVWEALECLA